MSDENHLFVRVRTVIDNCELCRMDATTYYRLFHDKNGAIVCFDCASEFGWIGGIDVPFPATIGGIK